MEKIIMIRFFLSVYHPALLDKLYLVNPIDFYCSYKDIKPKTKLSRVETEKKSKSRPNQNKTSVFSVLNPSQLCPCGYEIASQLSLIGRRLASLKAWYHIAFSFSDFFHRRKSALLCFKGPTPFHLFRKFVLHDKTDKEQMKSMRHRSKERYLVAPDARKVLSREVGCWRPFEEFFSGATSAVSQHAGCSRLMQIQQSPVCSCTDV